MSPGPPKVTLCCPGPLALLIADAMVTPAVLVERMMVSEPVEEIVPPLKVMPEEPVKSMPLATSFGKRKKSHPRFWSSCFFHSRA